MRVFELIAIHILIFAGLTIALSLASATRVLFAWLVWNWRRFRQETRRAAWFLGALAAVGHAAAALSESTATDGRTWPAFRGEGTSVTSATGLPLTWSDSESPEKTGEFSPGLASLALRVRMDCHPRPAEIP